MAIVGFFSLMFCFFSALSLTAFCVLSGLKGKKFEWIEYGQKGIFLFVSFSCLILIIALYNRDFSFNYVWEYTDTYLPWYYALSAFWAGQSGSLLLWTFFIALGGVVLIRSRKYFRISLEVKNTFWSFFFAIESFFFMVLVTVANPFLLRSPVPNQGNGLNPLLMHPGMVFHPPLLFLGYAGFVIPSLLLLSERMCGITSSSTSNIVRSWSLLAWIFLSAGIILGAWWSYFELGWGGYWAWDPVENASLIPWLSATAFLHVYILKKRSGVLDRTSSFLAGLTLVFCFFATFLTRSGIIESLHAFGKSNLGMPFLFLILFSSGCVLYITLFYPSRSKIGIGGVLSREGLLVITTWIFMSLCVVIIIGSLYPIISGLLTGTTKGVGASFYNHIFLPIFCGILMILILCPWSSWKEERIRREGLIMGGGFLLVLGVLWLLGIRERILLLGISVSGLSLLSVIFYLLRERKGIRHLYSFSRWGIHLAMALMALSIAISSGYKRSAEFIISKGQVVHFHGYTLKYEGFSIVQRDDFTSYRSVFKIFYRNRSIGSLVPEKRIYHLQNNSLSKVAVLNRLVDEIYLTVLDVTRTGVLKLEVEINPMVHWIWISGVLLCVFAFMAYKRT